MSFEEDLKIFPFVSVFCGFFEKAEKYKAERS